MRVETQPGQTEADRRARPALELDAEPQALETFIAEQLEPAFDQLHRWQNIMDHEMLLHRAARRKKMTITKINDSNVLFFLAGMVVGGMDTVVTSLVSHQARRVSASKAMTKKYLQAAEVPTPRGRAINPTEFSRAVQHLKKSGGPVTVKPSAGRAGRGITTAVTTKEQLRQAWTSAMAARSATSSARYVIMVEEHRPGLDIRAYVVGETVVAAVARVPFYVIGDGLSTVGELAAAELERRRPNAYLSARQPRVTDAFLAPMGITMQTVPERGALQLLTPTADTARGGGLAVDVLELLSDELRDLAADGLLAVPGLGAGAVDMLAPDLGSAAEAVVLDVNPYANLMQFHYPAYGTARRVNDPIIDQLLHRASR
ncbi:hypothetical protein [Nesterenkonia lutea]|uniref:D-alanine-D-alanine ligase-like ATP-grasp enzyme n=1 Tax=Nesterenkonia lutea TaxID=272919 RepID=A0ABR9JHB8_9MICC|nr:hypothetical protein [Nesterenkonia lutea]MBE1524877.1 D-alanine-D-alanine ligase-like ATP-grasp enzyme [Nesterenkonia lutea]